MVLGMSGNLLAKSGHSVILCGEGWDDVTHNQYLIATRVGADVIPSTTRNGDTDIIPNLGAAVE